MVAVAGDQASPRLLLRRRVDLLTSDLPNQPYHVASRLSIEDAERLIEEVKSEAVTRSLEELQAAIGEVNDLGYEVLGVGLAAEERRLPPLEKILRAHALSHMAEGEIFHGALVEASTALGLAVHHLSPSDAGAKASAEIGTSQPELTTVLTAIGKESGPPWQEDQRLATMAALCALALQP
jgi:hypothetical protein